MTGRIFASLPRWEWHPARLIHTFGYHIIMKGI
jgi:hypothetical protein